MKHIYEERLELLDKSPVLLQDSLYKLAYAMYRRNQSDEQHAEEKVADTFSATLALADLMGRKRMLMEIDHATPKQATFLAWHQHVCGAKFGALPMGKPSKRAFEQAFADVLDKEPRLRPVAKELEKTYGLGIYRGTSKLIKDNTQRAKFELQLRLHGHILRMGQRGVDQAKAAKVLAAMFDTTESYAQTAYRTVVSGALTAGMFRQAQTADAKMLAPAFQYTSAKVPTSRPNHMAGDGLIAGVDDPIWFNHAPPFGFNCLCGLRVVTRFELQDRGLLRKNDTVKLWYPPTYSAFRPDPGFKVEPPAKRYAI